MLVNTSLHESLYWNKNWLVKPETRNGVRSEFGAMRYWLTELGKQKYIPQGKEKKTMDAWYAIVHAGADEMLSDINEYMENYDPRQGSRGEDLEAYLKNWDNPYLALEFTPESKIGIELSLLERTIARVDAFFD